MKQLLMLTALCAASAMSAITVSWYGNTAAKAGTSTLTTTTDFSQNFTSLTIVISDVQHSQWIASQAGAVLFTVYGNNGTAGANGITLGGTSEGTGTTSKSYFDMHINGNGELTFGVAGNKGENGYRSSGSLGNFANLFANTDTLTLTLNKTGNQPNNISITVNETTLNLGSGEAFGFASGYEWDRIDVTTLPEPTVLALLALGVAGLALRRKVA